MIKTSINLQDLRRKIYIKAKAETKGFGWDRWSKNFIYQRLGLYADYKVRYI